MALSMEARRSTCWGSVSGIERRDLREERVDNINGVVEGWSNGAVVTGKVFSVQFSVFSFQIGNF